ncbi:SAV_915 family protein [Saccharopolyspora sp. NPDC050389]|uniref:SAV_915 family protein n=1 Tax=Saccharopolyspora sp. NPDC050389 TaxID=3155516 RepID=UPI0034079E1E
MDEQVISPSVLGGEPESVVYVPTERVSPGAQRALLELRSTTGGELALLIYTSLERLVETCGDRQPWISVAKSEVQTLAEQAGASLVLEDFAALPDTDRPTGEA